MTPEPIVVRVPEHDHHWQPGPVTSWTNTRRDETGMYADHATGRTAIAMAVLCPCGEWRLVPLEGRYRGEVPER